MVANHHLIFEVQNEPLYPLYLGGEAPISTGRGGNTLRLRLGRLISRVEDSSMLSRIFMAVSSSE